MKIMEQALGVMGKVAEAILLLTYLCRAEHRFMLHVEVPLSGGLIVIKSTNPWNTSETIYFTYAHLKERKFLNGADVKVNDPVSTGWQIGKSGGGSTDVCRGNSTGAHLHFQIDKDDGNNEPWFPTNVNTPDSGFQATAKTYNPIVFITGGYRWTFEQSGSQASNREYWELFNFSSWGVTGGYLWMDGNLDPYVKRGGGQVSCGMSYLCSNNIAAEAAFYKRVHLKMYNYCVSNPLRIYFITKDSPTWNETKSVTFNLPGTGSVDIHVPMGSSNPSWWTGIITGLRVDPAVNCNPNASDANLFYNITLER
jgi:hypothetical protein